MNHSISAASSVEKSSQPLDSPLSCRLDGPSPAERMKRRLKALTEMSLLDSMSVPVFEEAAEVCSRFVDAPVCIISVVDELKELFKAATGLSQLGLIHPLAQIRQIDLTDSLAVHILDSVQVLVVANTLDHPALSSSAWVQHYSVRAYAGVPLLTSQGICIGVLSVMDFSPHRFTHRDLAFLQVTSRWCMSEYERIQLSKAVDLGKQTGFESPSNSLQSLIDSVRIHLIGELTQELRSPLTSVVGMASMLSREIYGPLTEKQREYAEIVRSSSQMLMSLVDEIMNLGQVEDSYQQLSPTPVDIEMLGQQVLKTLNQVAQKREQRLNLTVEPGLRTWVLDKGKVKQLIYHLVFSVIQMAGESSTVRLHASRRSQQLNLSVWLTNPWIGEGLPQLALKLCRYSEKSFPVTPFRNQNSEGAWLQDPGNVSQSLANEKSALLPEHSRELLGLLLSRYLAELHKGSITIQGSPEAGYRFVVKLPTLTPIT